MIVSLPIKAQKTKERLMEWRVAGVLPPGNDRKTLGVAGAIAGINNDMLFVAGGANFPDAMPWMGGKKKYQEDVYVFKKNGDSLIHYKTAKLPFALAYAAGCTTPGGIAAIGGENEKGLSDNVFLLQWDAVEQGINIQYLPSLPFALTNASAVFYDNKIYVAGGERANDVSNELLQLDLEDPGAGWQHLPVLPVPVSHAVVAVRPEGKSACIYVIGGRKRNISATSTLYSSTLQYDLQKGRWTERASLPYALSAGTGTALDERYIILFGGDAGKAFHRTESLLAAISKETDGEKKKALNAEKIQVQSTHPGFCRQIFLYDALENKWKALNRLPFETPVTTTAVLWKNNIVIPGGEIRAGVRSPNILALKIQ